MKQFTIRYKDQLLAIRGELNSYSVSYAGKKTIIIEHMADGWYKINDEELYWTDHDVAAIGALIEKENPSGFHGIPFN